MIAGVIDCRVNPALTDDDLNRLFTAAWGAREPRRFGPILERSLAYIGAFDGGRLIGFVNLAWDGGVHAFLLDTTVHPAHQRRGIGRRLVAVAARVARERGIEWLHVDYEARFEPFYRACGFMPTTAGLLNLCKATTPIPQLLEGQGV